MKRSLWAVFACSLLSLILGQHAKGATLYESLYINRDSLQSVSGAKMPYMAFNQSTGFQQKNAVVELNVGDSLNLWVVNNDTAVHEFDIKGVANAWAQIPANDSVNIAIKWNIVGAYIYYDPMAFPTNCYLGLGGLIVVKNHSHSSFYWNLKEHTASWNELLTNGGTVDWSTYYPQYFTLNGNSNPHINADPTARITGNVGDTLIINVANTGKGVHSLHFHGYHALVMYSSKNASHMGRSKDTFAIHPMETLVLRLVPDKPGEYPVHDHNLVAVTGNENYPNGMFSTILIDP